jgi:hypothetical protein
MGCRSGKHPKQHVPQENVPQENVPLVHAIPQVSASLPVSTPMAQIRRRVYDANFGLIGLH